MPSETEKAIKEICRNVRLLLAEYRAQVERETRQQCSAEHDLITGVLADALQSKLSDFERNLQNDDMTLTIEQGEFQEWSAALDKAEVAPRPSGWGVLVGERLLKDAELNERTKELMAAEQRCAELAAALDRAKSYMRVVSQEAEGYVKAKLLSGLDTLLASNYEAILAAYHAKVERETLERVRKCKPTWTAIGEDLSQPSIFAARCSLLATNAWDEAIEREFAPKGEIDAKRD